jgi:hypothetical protein
MITHDGITLCDCMFEALLEHERNVASLNLQLATRLRDGGLAEGDILHFIRVTHDASVKMLEAEKPSEALL